MQSLTERDIDKLAKILGMLGSRHPAEAAAAAHRATEFLKQRGWQWIDVLKVPGLAAPTYGTPDDDLFAAWPDNWRGAVRFCLRHKAMLTRWERDFVEKIETWHSISVKQRPVLDGIVGKLREMGCRP
jgi:hypothetical protein